MVAVTLLIAGAFYIYYAVRQGTGLRTHLIYKMQTDLNNYNQNVKRITSLQVAQDASGTYTVTADKPWKVDRVENTILVNPPMPANQANGQPLPEGSLPEARKVVEDYLWTWIDHEFQNNRKNIQLEVHFEGEPPRQ